MELMNKITQEKMCTITTRYYYSDDKEINISPNEKFISQVYVPWRKDYLTITKEYKDYSEIKNGECNFISKIRALTREYELLSFSQKYPVLALDIENAAKKGRHHIWFHLNEKMIIEDLHAEGFTVEDEPYEEGYKISW